MIETRHDRTRTRVDGPDSGLTACCRKVWGSRVAFVQGFFTLGFFFAITFGSALPVAAEGNSAAELRHDIPPGTTADNDGASAAASEPEERRDDRGVGRISLYGEVIDSFGLGVWSRESLTISARDSIHDVAVTHLSWEDVAVGQSMDSYPRVIGLEGYVVIGVNPREAISGEGGAASIPSPYTIHGMALSYEGFVEEPGNVDRGFADGVQVWQVTVRESSSPEGRLRAFRVIDVQTEYSERGDGLTFRGTLVPTAALVSRMGLSAGSPVTAGADHGHVDLSSSLTDTPIGELEIFIPMQDFAGANVPSGHVAPSDASAAGTGGIAGEGGMGPDVIVGNIHEWKSWGTLGIVTAFSIGTISCNAGDVPLDWYPNTDRHPVIAQNMYRLKNGRFEQIGQSWVKHGFAALTGDECDYGCIEPPGGQQQLGVGCSDPYSANLNGNQFYLGPRSDINAYTGEFPAQWSAPPADATIGRRIQVMVQDMQPNQNPGAKWFAEAHYVTPDDAQSGNGTNNASYREFNVFVNGPAFSLSFPDVTRREQPAIRAWKAVDPGVMINGTTIIGDGTVFIGSRATDLGGGWWHYEYAVHNLNSHRSIRSFSVPLPENVDVDNVGFRDVHYHSGESYSTADWNSTSGGGTITWNTETFAQNEDANAIRWGTLYNFRFDATTPPVTDTVSLGYFRPGSPSTTSTFAFVPATPAPVCGDDFVAVGEECDPPDGVHCDAECQWICGDGVVQSGEECDPPDGVTCDSVCEIIYICGDGVVDPDEECDPPNGVTCDAECQRIPICGDGIIDPDEDCDPPNGATCDANCESISNDDCVSAVSICPGTFGSSTFGTTNDGSTTCDNTPGVPDSWYRYVPLTDGTMTVSTCGSGINTVLSVHSACSGLPQDELDCNNDSCGTQSEIEMDVTAGTPYLIRLAGFQGQSGAFTLTLDGPACATGPALNDECVFAQSLVEGRTPFTTNGGMTDGPDEPSACGGLSDTQLASDAWFCYEPSCTGTLELRLCDTDFDAALAVYDACTCPVEADASTCAAADCGESASVTIAVTAGDSLMIRVGGLGGTSGVGVLDAVCRGTGDVLRGGQLYDNWWMTSEASAPAGTHPLYPPAGQQSGSVTFRCQECHGWDYLGVDGVYGSGEHFTGIGGVLDTALSQAEIFDLVRGTQVTSGHGFETFGMTHQDIWDVAAFIESGAISLAPYVDGAGSFVGDAVQGELNFTTGGATPCAVCHGSNGAAIDFGDAGDPEWIGTVAYYDPWRLFHKIRYGQPGAAMPSWLAAGGNLQGAADIGRYAQTALPVDCLVQADCEDGLYCTGDEICDAGLCSVDVLPCAGEICDETLADCLSGNCSTPVVVADGSRSISITPAPGATPVALWIDGVAGDPFSSCTELYVQEDGSLDAMPFFQLPAAWGTIRVRDEDIWFDTSYSVRADCGTTLETDYSSGVDVMTWAYGDVDQNGIANFADIQATVQGFQGMPLFPITALDIAPCKPDTLVNFSDILVAVLAFQMTIADCPVPCN